MGVYRVNRKPHPRLNTELERGNPMHSLWAIVTDSIRCSARVLLRVTTIQAAEPDVVNLGLDIFGLRGMDGFAEFLAQFAKRLGQAGGLLLDVGEQGMAEQFDGGQPLSDAVMEVLAKAATLAFADVENLLLQLLSFGEILENDCPILHTSRAYAELNPTLFDLERLELSADDYDVEAWNAGWVRTTVAAAIARST